jgi:hypothetical protein
MLDALPEHLLKTLFCHVGPMLKLKRFKAFAHKIMITRHKLPCHRDVTHGFVATVTMSTPPSGKTRFADQKI